MEQVCEIRKELQRVGYQHMKIMDIEALCQHIIGKTIVEAEAYYDNSQLNITLNDGTYIEITCDSVYSEVPELDD
jgi:hypothetical protein